MLTTINNARMRQAQTSIETCKTLQANLSSKLEAGFVETDGCYLLVSEADKNKTIASEFPDRTGFECFVNHFHCAALGEALAFCDKLAAALQEKFGSGFTIIVSWDGSNATVRFHKTRSGESWVATDLESYTDEAIRVVQI